MASPILASANGSTPLEANLRSLDLGDNALLAWTGTVQNIFAATSSTGYSVLGEL